ncbi:MAG: group II intron reverse transcriptase/maturase [Rubrivivax sp.]|nr:group II intron reverse transcriptase/maturase [Rubrivivax sp.]
MMHGLEKSDLAVVAMKPANNAGSPAAEWAEPRAGTKGNADPPRTRRTQSRDSVSQGLERVRQAARQRKRQAFTALLHHVTVDALREAFLALKRRAAPGVDGVTWQDYELGLEDRLQDLHTRVHRGTYRALPVRRRFIPKPDGRQRPLGIAALEDKIVQRAVVTVLNAIYEEDFLGFSYGVRHRVGDERIARLVGKWLKAGVLEDGQWSTSDQGTPQGAVISPLLANVYLHYVFDLWAQQWRRREAKGDMIVVRYADDLVVGFELEAEARRFWDAMRSRFEQFSLELHGEKTRLLEFGRYAIERRQRNGQGKPETFNFLGFTFICGRSRRGAFLLRRHTRRDRMRAALEEIKDEMRRRRHDSLTDQGRWLRSVVAGYFAYHAVPTNAQAIGAYRHHVLDLWRRSLKRRSQKGHVTWARMDRLANEWLPPPHVLHPWPEERMAVRYPR